MIIMYNNMACASNLGQKKVDWKNGTNLWILLEKPLKTEEVKRQVGQYSTVM